MIPIRDSQPSYSKPLITTLIIALNVLAFLFQLSLDPVSQNDFVAVFAFIPDRPHLISVLTSMFLHGGWMHLIGNMLFLWVYGDNVEDILGHFPYLIFYLLCGASAAGAQFLINPDSRIPMVGASGAIAGVMGAYMVKFPHSRITMLFWMIVVFTFELPAYVVLLYWFALQFFSGVGSVASMQTESGGTAFFAHVGGFVAGVALIYLFPTRDRYRLRRDLLW